MARSDGLHNQRAMLTETFTLCLIVRFIGLYDGSVFVDDYLEAAIRIMATGGDWKTNRCCAPGASGGIGCLKEPKLPKSSTSEAPAAASPTFWTVTQSESLRLSQKQTGRPPSQSGKATGTKSGANCSKLSAGPPRVSNSEFRKRSAGRLRSILFTLLYLSSVSFLTSVKPPACIW